MRVEIRRKEEGGSEAVIITIHTRADRFASGYERSKFFRELHGWNQTVPHEQKRYVYRRRGVLDDVPHVKIADSVFMVAVQHMERMRTFLDGWEEKVEFDLMHVKVMEERMRKMLETGEHII